MDLSILWISPNMDKKYIIDFPLGITLGLHASQRPNEYISCACRYGSGELRVAQGLPTAILAEFIFQFQGSFLCGETSRTHAEVAGMERDWRGYSDHFLWLKPQWREWVTFTLTRAHENGSRLPSLVLTGPRPAPLLTDRARRAPRHWCRLHVASRYLPVHFAKSVPCCHIGMGRCWEKITGKNLLSAS